jgi:two-component system, chemotaxis family, chemotaxis protein CheY
MMKNCLVVDDSAIIRKMARLFLEKHNFKVEEAENGEIAGRMLSDNYYEVILLDWSMPNMDGLTLLKWLRSSQVKSQKSNVIFCTSQNNIEDIQKAILMGANEYIIKPFNAEIIKNKLDILGLI